MDKKLNIFDYFTQTFMIYGITVVLLNIFCLLFGEGAREYSSIFAIGREGLSIVTMLQFLLAIAITVALRFVFMTDYIIKKMPLPLRIILMFAAVFVLIVAFVAVCGWFPVNEPKAWLMFIVCFVVSCAASTLISSLRDKQENKKLEKAIEKYKEDN